MRALRNLAALLLAVSLVFTGCATKKEPAPTAADPALAAVPAPSPAPEAKKGTHWANLLPWNWPAAIARSLVKKKPKAPRALPPQLIGVIKMVNKEDQFVLIDAFAYQAAQPGDSLVCLADQRETASLRLSTLRNPPFLIGDITSGSPSPGERVYKP